MSDVQTPIEGWAVLDLFGHQHCAGYLSTVIVGTSGMFRIEVPLVEGQPAFTRFYSPGAVYSLTLVTEDLARAAAKTLRPEPVTVSIPRQLPGSMEYGDDTFDDKDEEDSGDE